MEAVSSEDLLQVAAHIILSAECLFVDAVVQNLIGNELPLREIQAFNKALQLQRARLCT